MDIAAFISESLEHENELVVPGLGLFYRSRIDGYYSKELNQFYPPTLQLLFNPDVTEDDGKMVGLLMADRGITASDAREAIAEFVSKLLMQAGRENVAIGNLGTLSSRRNMLVFAARRLSNNNELFYGLVPVKLKRSSLPAKNATNANEDIAVTTPETHTPVITTAPVAEHIETATEDNDAIIYPHENEANPKRSTNWILIAALLLLAAGLGLIGAYKYRPDLLAKYVSGTNPNAGVSDIAIRRHRSDSVNASIQAQKDIGVKPKLDSVAKTEIETPVDTFAIVIATIKNYASAQKELDRYSYKGYNVEMRKMPNKNGWYQIDIAAYYNLDSARAQVAQFKAKLRQTDLTVQKYPYKAK